MTDVEADPVEAAPETEPVRVAELSEIQERIASAMDALHDEMAGLRVVDEEGLQTFQRHVSLRVAQWRNEGLANAILSVLLIEWLCGTPSKPVVKVPRKLIERRIAMAGR